MSHRHEWGRARDRDDVDYEDHAWHIYEQCEYVEVLSVQHSERWDETFEETGYECDTLRVTTYRETKVQKVVPESDKGPAHLQLVDDTDELEQLDIEIWKHESDHVPDVVDAAVGDESEFRLTVEIGDDMYLVTYESEGTEVL